MSALLPKADKAAEPSGCPLSAKSRHTHCSEANEASRVHHAARRCTHEPVAPPSRAWTPTQYNSSGDPANAIAIQGGFHVGYWLDYTTRGAWRRGARWRRSGAWQQRLACASRRTQDLRSHSRRLSWRLVLAEGRRHFGETRPQGLRAVADWPRRPLASFEREPDARHAHHRHLQPVQMGRDQECLLGAAFLW